MHKFLLTFVAVAAATITAPAQTSWTFGFDTQEAYEAWTVLDPDNDAPDIGWSYSASDKAAMYKTGRSYQNGGDDRLITPAVALKAGQAYEISFSIKNAYSSDSHIVKYTVGTTATAEGQGTVLESYTGKFTTSYKDYILKYTPEADGDYYFGMLCNSTVTSGKLFCNGVKIEAVATHPGAVTDLKAEAAAQGALQAILNWTWPTANDCGGEQADDIAGAKIYRNTSSMSSADDSYLIATVEGGKPGEAATYTDNAITKAGKYYYLVATFNAEGDSKATPATVTLDWVGEDTGVNAASGITATVVDDNTIQLTWAPVVAGKNGGYINPADVTYRITRTAGSNSAVEIENAWQGELPYTDSGLEGLNTYTYTVYTYYKGSQAGWSGSSSNAVVAGGSLSLPYAEDFSTSASYELWSMFHGADGTRDWKVSSSKLNYWGGPTADAWAVTPAFNLEAGKVYELTFRSNVSRASSPKNLAVSLGTAAAAESMQTTIYDKETNWTIAQTKSVKFTVAENGKYHIGFHCHGTSDSYDIYVDDITLDEALVSPLAVTDLKAEAAGDGSLKVSLSWTNPTLNNAGSTLDELTKVELYRGDELVRTYTESVPGAAMTDEDNVSEAGIYTYGIITYYGDGASEKATAETAWVGVDVPKAVAAMTTALNDDKTEMTISYEPVTEGEHNGYIGTVSYRVTRMPGDVEVATTTGTQVIDEVGEASLGNYYYTVVALNEAGESAAAESEKTILGSALELPYETDFGSAESIELWTMLPVEGSTSNWSYSSSNSCLSAPYKQAWAFTPPFKTVPGEYRLTYKASKAYNFDDDAHLMVYLANEPSANADAHTLINDHEGITAVNYPDDTTVNFTITENDGGNRHIGFFQQSTDGMKLRSVKVELVKASGVDDIVADGCEAFYNGSAICTAAGTRVIVCSLDGRVFIDTVSDGTVSTDTLSAGIYAVRAGAAAFKFVK